VLLPGLKRGTQALIIYNARIGGGHLTINNTLAQGHVLPHIGGCKFVGAMHEDNYSQASNTHRRQHITLSHTTCGCCSIRSDNPVLMRAGWASFIQL
jgi:hypothetical protein